MMKSSIPVPEEELKAVTSFASDIVRLYEELGEDYRDARHHYAMAMGYASATLNRMTPHQQDGAHETLNKLESRARAEKEKLSSGMKEKLSLSEPFDVHFNIGIEYKVVTYGTRAVISTSQGRTYTLDLDKPEQIFVEYEEQEQVPRFFGRWGTKTVKKQKHDWVPITSPQPQEASSS